MKLTLTAEREAKLLSLLRRELGMSSTLVKRLKFRRAFTVNGTAVFTDHPVHIGDRVEVLLDEPTPDYPAEDGPLDILCEDAWLIALDKPAGLLMHPSSARNTGTLANFLTAYYRRTDQPCAVHPVSRLDRDTFGVVLLAKSSHVHAKLHALQRVHGIEKRYIAAVLGVPPLSEGQIDAPIARHPADRKRMAVIAGGRESRTEWRVLERLHGATYLDVHLLTGRTHQIRVHMQHIGHPLLGDPIYAPNVRTAVRIPRLMLHAYSLAFTHPATGERMSFCAPLPADFETTLQKLSV